MKIIFDKNEKKLVEEIIEFYKENEGSVTSDEISEFLSKKGIKILYIKIRDKMRMFGLIDFKLVGITGATILRDKGWEFTTFRKYESDKKLKILKTFTISIVAVIIGTLISYWMMKCIFKWI